MRRSEEAAVGPSQVCRTISSPVILWRSSSWTLVPPRLRRFVEGVAATFTTSHRAGSAS